MSRIEEIFTMRELYLRKYYKEVRKAMINQINPIYEEIGKAGEPVDVLSKIDELIKEKPITNIFYELWQKIGVTFALWEFRYHNQKKQITIKSDEEQFYIDIWSQELIKYANTEAGARITSITGTTKKWLQDNLKTIIQDVAEQGTGVELSARAIQRLLKTKFSEYAFYSAKRIAMTEILGASNRGHYVGAQSVGLPMMKVWRTSPGISKTDRHVLYPDLEGQTVNRDGMFSVNGNQALYPGDPRLPVEEVVNCKCQVEYVVI